MDVVRKDKSFHFPKNHLGNENLKIPANGVVKGKKAQEVAKQMNSLTLIEKKVFRLTRPEPATYSFKGIVLLIQVWLPALSFRCKIL